MYSIILLTLTIAIAPVFSRDPIFNGLCPTARVDVIQNFNQTKFQGIWYVIERYQESELTSCSRYDYKWGEKSRAFSEVLEELVRHPEDPETAFPLLVFHDLYEKEKLSNNGKYKNQYSIVHLQDYQFVDTDYENYAVLWTCIQRIGRNEQNLIVMARDKFFDINSSGSLNATLAKPPFYRSMLKPIDHKSKICETKIV